MVFSIPGAGGDLAYAASLHLAPGSLSLITTPVTLALRSNALNFQASVSPFAIAEPVGASSFLPLLLGIVFFAVFPRAAKRIRRPITIIGQAISLLTIVLILLMNYRVLLQMDLRSYSAMAIVFVLAL